MTSPPGAAQGFPRPARLLSGKDFDRVYALRQRVSDGYFSINYAPAAAGAPRLGLSVGAKMAGNAVSRNRVKRTIRESFRLHRPALPPLDLVVGARALVRTAHNARLRESLAQLWIRLAKQCATSPKD